MAMDLTNWKFGKFYLNLLVVTVILNGVGLLGECYLKAQNAGTPTAFIVSI